MSCSKWSYAPEKCDGDSCVGDCDCCHKSEIDEHNENMMTYNEIIDGLEMMDFFADRAGKELWFDKPTDIQNQDIAKHHQILQSAIKTLKEQQASKWIKCSDEMLPDGEIVLLYTIEGDYVVGIYWLHKDAFWFKETDRYGYEEMYEPYWVTHWMSLPDCPKGMENEIKE